MARLLAGRLGWLTVRASDMALRKPEGRGRVTVLSRVGFCVFFALAIAATTGLPVRPAWAQTAGPDEVVIRLGETKVTVAELSNQLAYQPNSILDTIKKEPNAGRVFAVRWFHHILFNEAAKADGFIPKKPGLQGAADEMSRRRIADAYVDDLQAQYQPTDQEIEIFYKLHGDTCKTPARYRLARTGVVVGKHATSKEVESAQERIADIERRLKAGDDFAEVVVAASDLEGKSPGGELGWVTDLDINKEIGGEVFRDLKVGGTTPVVKTARGFEIFKLLEKEDARTKTPAECRPEITKALGKQFDKSVAEGRADELAQRFGATMNLDAFLAAIAATQPVASDD